MNTSKIDVLAMAAAQTRAKMMHVNEAKAVPTAAHGEHGNKASSGNSPDIKSPTTTAINIVQIHTVRPNGRLHRGSSRERVPTFPEKLHAILNNPKLNSIVTWLPSGKSFCILNKDAFTKNVLPMYFKESLFESFSRRLKRWGYRKVYATGLKQIVITHDLFQKGRLDLCKMMNGRAGQSSKVAVKGAGSEISKVDESMIEQLAMAERSLQAYRNVHQAPERKTEMTPQVNQLPQVSPRPPSARTATAYPQAGMALPAIPYQDYPERKTEIMPKVDCSQVSPKTSSAPAATMGSEAGMEAPRFPYLNNDTSMRNVCLHPRMPVSYQRGYEVGTSSHAGYKLTYSADVARRMSSIDQEIQECQEQLEILNRLRELREKRQRYF